MRVRVACVSLEPFDTPVRIPAGFKLSVSEADRPSPLATVPDETLSARLTYVSTCTADESTPGVRTPKAAVGARAPGFTVGARVPDAVTAFGCSPFMTTRWSVCSQYSR